MVKKRAIDLLPEIFQTPANKQFFVATVEQMTQEAALTRTQGFVGRRIGPGVNPNDRYITEPTATRTDYQLEPGVVFQKPDTTTVEDLVTFPGIVDSLEVQGADVTRLDRLFQSEFYSFDPFVDLDKFVNYSQYYWIAGGPSSVDVAAQGVPLTDDFTVTSNEFDYTFSGQGSVNPTITLARGGTYKFEVNQSGKFWIQAAPGTNGTLPQSPNISSRDVLGVVNNGEDNGLVTFYVPRKTAQDNYYNLEVVTDVDLIATDIKIADINNIYVSEFFKKFPQGIDGISALDTRTIIFTNRIKDAETGGWQLITQFDPLIRTVGPRVSRQVGNYDMIDRTVPNRIATNEYYDETNFDTIQRVEPNQISAMYGYSVSNIPGEFGTYDADLYDAQKEYIVSGLPDPLDGSAGTFDAPAFVTVGPVDPADGLPGTFDTTPWDQIYEIITGSEDDQDGFPGSFDSLPFDQVSDITMQSQRYSRWQINYVPDDDGELYMTLTSIGDIPNLTRWRILYGNTYSSTQWFKNASGYFEQIPLLTAIQDTLYYQDGTDPNKFGQIRLVENATSNTIDIDEIIGAKNYTSPNGVVFTNGLKIQFRGPTDPPEWQDLEFYVEGVGTGPGRDARVGFIDGEAYFGPFHLYNGRKMTGAAHSNDVFQLYIWDTVAESLANRASGGPEGAPLPTTPFIGQTEGNGIMLVPVSELITPETYTKSTQNPYDFLPYDIGNYDTSLNEPLVQDYITINRASEDRNPWSRSNRWFHVDVLRYGAELNNTTLVIDNNLRAKRPIIEFRDSLKLFNFGTQGIQPVNIIDFAQTDAFSNINGQTGYGVDGIEFLPGMRVIFANDRDILVKNRIYEVTFIDPNNSGTLRIELVPTFDSVPSIGQCTVCLQGLTLQGKSFWYNGETWVETQPKTDVNQPPLFDVFDGRGRSFSDSLVYPSTTFRGSQLFGYAIDPASPADEILGITLKFLNINNIGDIVFENYFYNDSFIYVENRTSITANISEGFVRQYENRINWHNLIGWQVAAAPNRSRQVFKFTYANTALRLDVPIDLEFVYAPVQIYVNGNFLNPNQYTYVNNADGSSSITITGSDVAYGDTVEVQVISDVASKVAFYQLPSNLENNPLNKNSGQFTLGGIRNHYNSIAQNLRSLQGPINGANNTRDLGNILLYGTDIVQQSSPLTLAGTLLRNQRLQIFDSIAFNSINYEKFKAQLLDYAARGPYINLTPTQILDAVMQEIGAGRNEQSPFYWSDMLPSGEDYNEINYTYSFTSGNKFDLTSTYDFTSSNYRSVLVYLNGKILTRGYDYTIPVDTAAVIITTPLEIGDAITIREYATTYGSYVPNTPTKMGLYPKFKPEIFLDESYVEPQSVIRGHDGSITVAFGDWRDDLLLEYETRVYNNIKIVGEIPLSEADVIPGFFRKTDYLLTEINDILKADFLNWVGWNKLNYTQQVYVENNPFTYNYSQSGNRINGAPLLGAWRGIYLDFYDTIEPSTRPWELLGFSDMPAWWPEVYGPPPYTSGNLVLWGDLERGLVADPVNPYIDPRYARPGLTQIIPSNSEGVMLSPLKAVVGNYDATSFQRSWVFGDDGPVENAWRSSSAWPFAVMRLLALTKPAQFFSLFVDRDRYKLDAPTEQYLWNNRYRLDAKDLAPLYGSGTSRASYINWIHDYYQQDGVDATEILLSLFDNLDVRLCWRMASFSDKRYLKIYLERSTPRGNNTSLLLPDESYQIILYENPVDFTVTYSSVVVTETDSGWQVSGYNQFANYFEILASRPSGQTVIISAGGSEERVSTEYYNTVIRVPYSYEFTSRGAVCDFLLSYGRLLEQRGLTFDDVENGYTLNWQQMAQEFLYWSNQGWGAGSLINLNPAATRLKATQPFRVVSSLYPSRPNNLILDQNNQAVSANDLVIERENNNFSITSINSNTINYARLDYTSFEHVMILDNASAFGDLIYDPPTGDRQSRVLVSGWLSSDWNGTVNAPGFVLNRNNIEEWQPDRKYTKGEIVLYKNKYFSATQIVPPSAKFDFNYWYESDYNQVQKGLLPNATNVSDQLQNAYSIYDANLETEVDLFSYGLIGFRPRQYMSALNLDDVSQLNLYQQFLKTKGTRPAAELFSLANLGKEVAQYDIYEYWAILRSIYGANANKSYFELLLNEALLRSDPSVVSVILPGQTSRADQQIFVNDIWKSSYKITSPNILPTTTTTSPDRDLPSAGYPSLDDVDITVFDLEDPTALAANLDQIGQGTTIWVARVNTYDWNVYRSTKVPGLVVEVSDNLNATSLVSFNTEHGLSVGDILIIREFSTNIDGVYRVLSVPTVSTVSIAYEFVDRQTTETGTGLGFTLKTIRVAQPADVANLPYATQLLSGVRIWVDNNGADRWTVLEKQDPYVELDTLQPRDPDLYSLFGESISQGLYNLSALVGAPNYSILDSDNPPGAVYTYVKTDQNIYEQNSILELNALQTRGYGNSLDVGDQNWAVVGASQSRNNVGYATTVFVAPGSNVFQQRQLLMAPDIDFGPAEFGYAVNMSQDERWMAIGAPGRNKTYIYNRIDVETQRVEYTTDGVTDTYNWNEYINIDPAQPRQLAVVLDENVLKFQVDYTVNDKNIVFVSIPNANQRLVISRRENADLDQELFTGVVATSQTGVGTGATFSVLNSRGVYSTTLDNAGLGYAIGDVLTVNQDDIDNWDAPATTPVTATYVTGYPGSTIVLTTNTGIKPGMVISGTGFTSGQYVTNITGFNTVVLNAPPDSVPSGIMTFSNDLNVIVASVGGLGNILTFTTTGSGVNDTSVFALDASLRTATTINSFSVTVNGILQRPEIDYDFNSDSSLNSFDLVFNTVPAPGARIVVSGGTYFQFVTLINNNVEGSRFGHSLSLTTQGRTLIVGAPQLSSNQGAAYVFDRSVQRFLVTDPTQTTFQTVQSLSNVGYIAVKVNGVYLTPEFPYNFTPQFTVDVNNPADEFVTILVPLNVGDDVEIETNQWTVTEVVQSSSPAAGAQFAYALDQCINDCSLYIGSPYADDVGENAGKVEFYQDQCQVFGTISSTVANPVLTAGNYIRINDIWVESTGTTVEELANDIVAANIPNATAVLSANLTFTGDGNTKTFFVGDVYSSATSYNTKVYLNDTLLTPWFNYTYNNSTQTISFIIAPERNQIVKVVSGKLTIVVKNLEASVPGDRLEVLPGSGTLFNDLALIVYVHEQTIVSPVPQALSHFGESVFISDDVRSLLIGAPNGSAILPTTFDGGETYFDTRTTNFTDTVVQSGAVYLFNGLTSVNPSVANPTQFVFGKQFYRTDLKPLDRFGAALDFTTGTMLLGAPGSDLGDSVLSNYGRALQFSNNDNNLVWQPKRIQLPAVDVSLMNAVSMYSTNTGQTTQYFDYFNPLQGRLLGVIEENIDFVGAIDPAAYNRGPLNNYGRRWAQENLGKIWWDTNRARFIDPNQDDIAYASRRWGQLFPGSSVEIYQWIASSVPPEQYTGPGTAKSIDSYTVLSTVDQQGFLQTVYYFWVTGIPDVSPYGKKTLSVTTLTSYIENPRGSGIPYIAPLAVNTIAIYNGLPYINDTDTVLSIEFERQATENAVHAQYQLIPQDRSDGFLVDSLYAKMQDSLCGTDPVGRAVPDPLLSPSQRYGVDIRPRQSMVVDRFKALENYLGRANTVMANFPLADGRGYSLLNSVDPEPTAASGLWDLKVANIEELSYQDLNEVPLGYRYLVESDATNNGLWTIYRVVEQIGSSIKELLLVQVQNYDTRLYWEYIDWYFPGYTSFIVVNLEVPRTASLSTLSNVPDGTLVKVTSNSQGKWEIYVARTGNWQRIALQDGTIKFKKALWDYVAGRFGFDGEVYDAQYFDEAPNTETRQIIRAINEQIFTGDLLIYRNRLLMLLFNYILSEQEAPAWLTKTSLIDVEHTIRTLEPYQVYRKDNQDFVLDYIKEVKPYHVQIREFNLKYQGNDTFQGNLVDFDLPAYYNTDLGRFVSPILDDNNSFNSYASEPSTASIWQQWPYIEWINNYTLNIDSVELLDGGSGYISPPEVVVTGNCTRPAVMSASISSAGRVRAISVIDPGEGYTETAIIDLVSSSGGGARAVARMGNSLVRSISTTIKYDRYQYQSTVLPWVAGQTYTTGTLVRYVNRVWQANVTVTSTEFDLSQWTQIPASALSGVDRTMGYYQPTPNMPGLSLPLLIDGVEYPGVQISAPGFDQNTGFDVGNYDINPYDNIDYGPEGLPTYDPGILDTIYASSFLDSFLGTRPTDVNVDGGAFVDAYESHAPEELVPGITFDTLDFRVYTTPGADWLGDGHGFPLESRAYTFDTNVPELSWDGLLRYPVEIEVFNITRGIQLTPLRDYTVDWVNYTATPVVGTDVADGDLLLLTAYSFGGGNQLYVNTYVRSDIVNNRVIVPYPYSLVNDVTVFINGIEYTNVTYANSPPGNTVIVFGSVFSNTDRITVLLSGGATSESGSTWSVPVTQWTVSDGGLVYELTNSVVGTNPANLIVTKNGIRARPPEGAEYFSDGTTTEFALPNKGGYDLTLVADNDVAVYVDGIPLTLGTEFMLEPAVDASTRYVLLTNSPPSGSTILLSVRTRAQYWVLDNFVVFQPAQGLFPVMGDVLGFTTYNDTRDQDIVTEVFVGPTTRGTQISEGFDTGPFDQGTVSGDPGSYDYGVGEIIFTNTFDTGREIVDPNRLIVTLDGQFLFQNFGYTVEGSTVMLTGPAINPTQVVVITLLAQNPVPDAMAFRVFQDMRGLQTVYRITPETTTELTQPLLATQDIIYVKDASKLSSPDLQEGIFGNITINGERILYRTIDFANNTISGLRRGISGTGAANHPVGAAVYDIGLGNMLPEVYQNRYVIDNSLGNGVQTTFVAPNINVSQLDSTEIVEAVQVYVGGQLQTSGFTIATSNPVSVVFDQAPPNGYQVSIRVYQGPSSWYQPGAFTPSNGEPLQNTDTFPARFLRGLA